MNEILRKHLYYEEPGITIYNADCRDILPHLEKVDLVLTDPPYGVMLGEVKNGRAIERQTQKYSQFSDTPQYIKDVVVPIISECINKFSRVIITPGQRNAFEYPNPDDIGGWFNPAGAGVGKWGFLCLHTILYYGKDPRAGIGCMPSSVTGFSGGRSEIIDHPCPKPIEFMRWMVKKGSLENETILDPFMGSGTTLRAAKDLGRQAIGIEIEEKYCAIAVKRLQQEVFSFK